MNLAWLFKAEDKFEQKIKYWVVYSYMIRVKCCRTLQEENLNSKWEAVEVALSRVHTGLMPGKTLSKFWGENLRRGNSGRLMTNLKSEFFYLPSFSSLNLFKMSSKQDQSIRGLRKQ
jgi:hypothetical protein